jgi:DNA polymerase-3 subunit epsilon
MNNQLLEAIKVLSEDDNYRVLTRVPESFSIQSETSEKRFKAAIIDLETTGLDSSTDEIIEIGTLVVDFTATDGLVEVTFTDNQLQEPSKPISAEITAITGITNEDVAGQSINWPYLVEALTDVDLVICHNARFDRQFLERQTPAEVSALFQKKAFGCSASDINWRGLGYEGAKLEYLNLKMGYFYDGHRALVDCWATLNILYQATEAFEQLKAAVRKKQRLICAINSDFDKKDLLKARGYRWSDGSKDLPKCWYTVVEEVDAEEELNYLNETIYEGRNLHLPQQVVNAFNRYSGREYQLKV